MPRGHTQLAAGDKIILMGTPEAMREVESIVRPGASAAAASQVTIIGGGDVGLQLAERLEKSAHCRRADHGARRRARAKCWRRG